MICFCECKQCMEVGRKTKASTDHCPECQVFMAAQEGEYQFLKEMNRRQVTLPEIHEWPQLET